MRSNQLLGKLLLVYLIILILFFVFISLLMQAQVVRQQDQHNLQQSEARLRALTGKLLSAQEDERGRISRELHDDLGQRVTAICLDLERTLQRRPGAERKSGTVRALEEARRLLGSIKAYSFRLRPQILDDLGLRDAVQSHLSEFENRTGIDTNAVLDFSDQDIPEIISENIYRILQEALNNVSKHASAERVFVQFSASSDRIALSIRDEGVGLDVTAFDDSSLGVLGMRERAELLGGTCALCSAKGQGTEVKVSIPIQTAVDQPVI